MAHTARKASVLCAAALLVAFVCSAHAQCSSTAPRGGSCGSGVCCSSGQCCSKFGFCGSTDSHCGAGCQQSFGTCSGGSSGGSDTPERPDTTPVTPNIPDAGNRGSGVGSIISAQLWNTMFPMRNKAPCQGAGRDFYSHAAFLTAAAATPGFGTSGDAPTNKRELAAFLAHISQETTGGGNTGGLCWIIEGAASGPPADRYCQASAKYPCATGKSYHGRGPIQLSWNYNYISAGTALGFDGLNNPDAVASDPVLAFRTAMWFWMTPQSPKPSAHDVMAGRWTPSAADRAAGRTPGFGVVTNVINGGLECGTGSPSAKEAGRVAYFRRYASLLGVSTGDNLSCASQRPFGA